VKKIPRKLFRGEKIYKTFLDPAASRDEARIHHSRAGAMLGAVPLPSWRGLPCQAAPGRSFPEGDGAAACRGRRARLSSVSRHAATVSSCQVTQRRSPASRSPSSGLQLPGHPAVVSSCQVTQRWSPAARSPSSGLQLPGHPAMVSSCQVTQRWSPAARSPSNGLQLPGHPAMVSSCQVTQRRGN